MREDEAEGIGRLGSALVGFLPEQLFASQRPGSQLADTLCKHGGRLTHKYVGNAFIGSQGRYMMDTGD